MLPEQEKIAQLYKEIMAPYEPSALISDLNGNIVYLFGNISEYFQAFTGSTQLNIKQVFSPSIADKIKQGIETVIDQSRPHSLHNITYTNKGKTSNLSVFFSIQEIASEAFVYIELQQKNNESKQILGKKKYEQILEGILDNTLAGIMVCEAIYESSRGVVDFKLLHRNAQADKLIGTTQNLLQKKMIESHHPHSKDGIFSHCLQVYLTGKAKTFEHFFTLRGENRVFLVVITKFQEGVIIFFEEITKRKEAEKKLIEATDGAKKANQQKTEFLSHLSHELRTPLNSILGFTELLTRQLSSTKHSKFLNAIKKSGTILLELINEILDLSKIESGSIELNEKPIVLQDLMLDMVEQFSVQIAEKNIVLNLQLPDPPLPNIVIDGKRLRQIITNLLSNAIKFTDEGKIDLSLKMHIKENKRKADVEIKIIDTGIGMSLQQQERIFEPFHQVESEQTAGRQGTGLGLSITKSLVERMAGTIKVWSSLGSGSAFTIELPSRTINTSVVNIPGVNIKIQQSPFRFLPCQLLIVDDIEFNRLLVRELLAHHEIKIWEAKNGKQALEICKTQTFDIILMDMTMPLLDGYRTTEILRGQEKYSNTPIIAFTAATIHEEVDKGYGSGITDYLTKPIQQQTFYEVLKKYLKYQENMSLHSTPEPEK